MKTSDLRAIVAKMTPGPWRCVPDSYGHANNAVRTGHERWEFFQARTKADNAGLAALRNHADVLLDLWEVVQRFIDGGDMTEQDFRRRATGVLARLEEMKP